MSTFDASVFDHANDDELRQKLEEARARLAGAREGIPTSMLLPAASPHAALAAVGAATLTAADVYGFGRVAAEVQSDDEGAGAECAAAALPPSGADTSTRTPSMVSRIRAAPRAVDAVASIRAWTLRLCGGPTATTPAAFVRREQYYRFHALLQQFMSVSHGIPYDPALSADEAAADWAHDLGGPGEDSEAQTMGCAVFERALHEFAASWAGTFAELSESARKHEAGDLLECAALFFEDLHEPDAVAARGRGSSRGGGGASGGSDAEEKEGEGAGDAPTGLDALNARVAAGMASIELADARARESLVDAREGRQARLRARLAEEREARGAQNEARLRDVRVRMAASGLYRGTEFTAARTK